MSNPILSKSKLIKSFLDPARIEFNSSLLNNITNIGKMVKGVPYKLRVERGQSLDSFLAYLFKTIRQHKPKSSQTSVVYEDITEKSVPNILFIILPFRFLNSLSVFISSMLANSRTPKRTRH